MEEPQGYYRIEDLDQIFVTEKDKTGNLSRLSLRELSNNQFENWAIKRFHQKPNPLIPDDVLEDFSTTWNDYKKLNLINRMCEVLGRPSCKLG